MSAADDLADEYDDTPRIDRLIDGATFILDEPTDVPSVWGTDDRVLWVEGEGFLLVGGSGVGKTTVGQQFTLRRIGVDTGDLLGLPVAATDDRLLYVAADRPRQIARSFRRMVDHDDRARLEERLVVWKGPPPGDLARYPDLLLEMCEKADARTVILDSLKDVAIGLALDEVGAGVNRAIQTALVEGIEVGRSTTNAKGTAPADRKPSPTCSARRGSPPAWAPSCCCGATPGTAYVDLLHLKQPASDVGPLKSLRHDHDTGTTEVVDRIDLVDLARLTAGGITAVDAARAVFDNPTPSRNEIERARRRLVKLAAAGDLVETVGSRGGGNDRQPARWRTPTILDLTAEP